VLPSTASDGIHDSEVTELSYRMAGRLPGAADGYLTIRMTRNLLALVPAEVAARIRPAATLRTE
jgi:hypothetical protein